VSSRQFSRKQKLARFICVSALEVQLQHKYHQHTHFISTHTSSAHTLHQHTHFISKIELTFINSDCCRSKRPPEVCRNKSNLSALRSRRAVQNSLQRPTTADPFSFLVLSRVHQLHLGFVCGSLKRGNSFAAAHIPASKLVSFKQVSYAVAV